MPVSTAAEIAHAVYDELRPLFLVQEAQQQLMANDVKNLRDNSQEWKEGEIDNNALLNKINRMCKISLTEDLKSVNE